MSKKTLAQEQFHPANYCNWMKVAHTQTCGFCYVKASPQEGHLEPEYWRYTGTDNTKFKERFICPSCLKNIQALQDCEGRDDNFNIFLCTRCPMAYVDQNSKCMMCPKYWKIRGKLYNVLCPECVDDLYDD